ncbi:MAG: EutN/CcmL family microcompartment protein [Elusimicrobiota bacterium]
MFVAKVLGNVWATRKHKHLSGFKLLIVKQIDPYDSSKLVGEAVMAVDGTIGAGPGDVVLVVDEGGSARKILGDSKSPVRTAVAGIIDSVNSRNREKKYA